MFYLCDSGPGGATVTVTQLCDPTEQQLVFFLSKFFPASALSSKVADSADPGQLCLYGPHYVHVVWDVHITDIPTGDKQVLQVGDLAAPVSVQHGLQPYVHKGVHVDDAAPRRAFVPQVHGGHLPLKALQQHHQAVLRDRALPDGTDDFP